MGRFTPLAGYGYWGVEEGTGDIVLLVRDTEVFRLSSSGAMTVAGVTATTLAATTAALTSLTNTPVTTSGVGAAGTNVTAITEYGVGPLHATELTASKDIGVGAAALAGGSELYTFPAKKILLLGLEVAGTVLSVGAGGAVGDLPETGMGVLIGSGVNAVLSGVGANAENLSTGTNVSGVLDDTTPVTANHSTITAAQLASEAVLYHNIAGTFSGADTVRLGSTVRILWAEQGL